MKRLSTILILIPLCLLTLASCGEGARIKEGIFAYVLENKDSIELDEYVLNSPYGYQEFKYSGTGDVTASVDYGYYYSEKDKYALSGGDISVFKDGYRVNNYGNDPTDWYYTEKIYDNWYYYELHDG